LMTFVSIFMIEIFMLKYNSIENIDYNYSN